MTQPITVKQIIPSPPGWFATYEYPNGTKEQVPIPVWALVEWAAEEGKESEREVVALVPVQHLGYLCVAHLSIGTFTGYRGPEPD